MASQSAAGEMGAVPDGQGTSRQTRPDVAATTTSSPARSRAHFRPTASVAILCLLTLTALLAPVLAPGDPSRLNLGLGPLPPTPAHPLGTDLLGRDVFGLAVHGARVSLAIGISAAAASAFLGVVLGLAAGYRGGWIEAVVCRAVEAGLAIPAFFLMVAVQSFLGPGVVNVVVLVALVTWMPVARVVRALVLSLKEREFVLAARALGCKDATIIRRHLLPNLERQVAVLYALGVADALLFESALSFLGLGVPSTVPSWGNMLSVAQSGVISGVWWTAAFPGALILVTVLSVNSIGDAIAHRPSLNS